MRTLGEQEEVGGNLMEDGCYHGDISNGGLMQCRMDTEMVGKNLAKNVFLGFFHFIRHPLPFLEAWGEFAKGSSRESL